MKNKKDLVNKILSYIGKYKFFAILSILFSALSSVLTLYIPILVGNAIDFVIGKNQVDFVSIEHIIFKILIIVLFIITIQWFLNIINNKITFNVVRDLRNKAFNKIQKLPLSFIDSHSNGDIVSRVISDAEQFSDGLLMGLNQLFSGVATIIVTICFMLYVNVPIALVVALLTPLSFFIAKFISKKTFTMFKHQSQWRGKQTSFVDEMIENQKVVEAYSHDKENLKEFDEINEKVCDYSLKATFYSSITNPATRFVNSIVYTSVAFFGAILVLNSSITVGILSSFLAYANQYTKPFNEISGVVTELQNALASAKRLFDLIELKEIETKKEDVEFDSSLKGNIKIDNVSFSYDKDKKVLKNISLDVKQGSKIAIVGHTGSGKTTLINLLMKFYDFDDGSILIDGVNIKNISRDSLRKQIGMVLQDTWIKSGTVLENISFGKPDATKQEVVEAAKKAHAHSFIKRLPDGYDTLITSNGENISAGQKQLICIARLMLMNPFILFLDEATSNIDTRTEIKIQKAFNNLMQNKTTFIVAHRLSTIKNADLIVVIDDGQIVESGKHEELLNKKGYYYNLYNSQFSNIID